jgi:hydrogenase maturation factor
LILTAQQILDTQKHRIEPVTLAEGQDVLVRSLPAHVVDEWKKAKNGDAYVFVNAVVGQDGKRLFTDEQVDHVAETVSSDVLSLVASKAFSLSVVPQVRQEEIKKNWQILHGAPSGESLSPSGTPIPT